MKIAPRENQMLGSLLTELMHAVAPFLSAPVAGETPLFSGSPAFLPLGSAPTPFPIATFAVTEL